MTKLRKTFSKFYRRQLLQQGISNTEFYKIWYINSRKSLEIQTSMIFSNVLLTVSKEHCTSDIMRQTTCLDFNSIMVEGYSALFSCMAAVVQA